MMAKTPLEDLVKSLAGGVVEDARLNGGQLTLSLRHGERVYVVYSQINFILSSENVKATLGSGGKIYLPVDAQRQLGLRPGDAVLIQKAYL